MEPNCIVCQVKELCWWSQITQLLESGCLCSRGKMHYLVESMINNCFKSFLINIFVDLNQPFIFLCLFFYLFISFRHAIV